MTWETGLSGAIQIPQLAYFPPIIYKLNNSGWTKLESSTAPIYLALLSQIDDYLDSIYLLKNEVF